jgi:hypothetical protein
MLLSAHGDDQGALSIVQSRFDTLPKTMATAELLQHLARNPQIAQQVPAFLIQSVIAGARPDQPQRYRDIDVLAYLRALPVFARVDGGERYRPGHTVGYSEASKGGDEMGIVYSGALPYAANEMLMLRAAQLAQTAGDDGFIVTDMETASARVALVHSDHLAETYAGRQARVIKASDVIASLGPIYIDLPAAAEAATSPHHTQ